MGSLIRKQGFRELGINAVAREAGVDKVLTYRYFNNLEGLLEAFLEERDYWFKTESISAIDLQTKEFNINGYPCLLLRLGYADKAPDSDRRDIEAVVV